jgi:hypothetical protein
VICGAVFNPHWNPVLKPARERTHAANFSRTARAGSTHESPFFRGDRTVRSGFGTSRSTVLHRWSALSPTRCRNPALSSSGRIGCRASRPATKNGAATREHERHHRPRSEAG